MKPKPRLVRAPFAVRAPLFSMVLLSLLFQSCLQRYYNQAEHDEPFAIVDGGKVEGLEENGILVFRGMPYAAPPTGPLRWRRPMSIVDWKGTLQAHKFGPDPMQTPFPGDQAVLGTTPDEDCLYINVWRPGKIPIGEKRPILVWIHGGGGVTGGSSAPIYDGSAIAREGIIFVSFNYRLGRFGYFAHPALSTVPDGALANYALMDQAAALRWIQRNITAFGGDPKHVTIMGESAGGAAVLHHLLHASSRELFSAAIVMSGGGRKHLLGGLSMEEAELRGLYFARKHGIEGSDSGAVTALRALSAEKIAEGLSLDFREKKDTTYAGGPIEDGKRILGSPEALFLKSNFLRIPLLIGTSDMEIPHFDVPDVAQPFSIFGADSALARALYNPDGRLSNDDVINAIGADVTMHEPARFATRQAALNGMPAWRYRFSYVADAERSAKKHAARGDEIPFALGTLEQRYGKAVSTNDSIAAANFLKVIVAFASQGRPWLGDKNEQWWPQAGAVSTDVMIFGAEGNAQLVPDPLNERLNLVEKHIKSTPQQLP